MRTLAHGERPPTTPRVGGPCPTFFGYQDTHGVAFLGEQAAAPPPQWTGRRPCEGRPYLADQYKIGPYAGPPRDGARPSGAEGGREAEGRFASPTANTGREGGRLCAAPLFCSLFMSPPCVSLECDFSAHGAKKDPRRGLTMATIFRLFPHRGLIHTLRRPAPYRPLPWHGGGVIPPALCLWVCHSTLTHVPHCDTSNISI